MANQRYYLKCKCGETLYIGKSLGDGIYNNRGTNEMFANPVEKMGEIAQNGDAEVLNEMYEWMWDHVWRCYGSEIDDNKLFEVVTEGLIKDSLTDGGKHE